VHLVLHLSNTFSTELVTGLLKVICSNWDGVVAKHVLNNFELSADALHFKSCFSCLSLFCIFDLDFFAVVLVEVLHLWEDWLVTEDRYAQALFNIKVTPEVLRHSLEKD